MVLVAGEAEVEGGHHVVVVETLEGSVLKERGSGGGEGAPIGDRSVEVKFLISLDFH